MPLGVVELGSLYRLPTSPMSASGKLGKFWKAILCWTLEGYNGAKLTENNFISHRWCAGLGLKFMQSFQSRQYESFGKPTAGVLGNNTEIYLSFQFYISGCNFNIRSGTSGAQPGFWRGGGSVLGHSTKRDPGWHPTEKFRKSCMWFGTLYCICCKYFKQFLVTPLLKKPSLDKDTLNNYRPISNLFNLKNHWTHS